MVMSAESSIKHTILYINIHSFLALATSLTWAVWVRKGVSLTIGIDSWPIKHVSGTLQTEKKSEHTEKNTHTDHKSFLVVFQLLEPYYPTLNHKNLIYEYNNNNNSNSNNEKKTCWNSRQTRFNSLTTISSTLPSGTRLPILPWPSSGCWPHPSPTRSNREWAPYLPVSPLTLSVRFIFFYVTIDYGSGFVVCSRQFFPEEFKSSTAHTQHTTFIIV